MRLLLAVVYAGGTVNALWVARRLRHGDPIRVMLLWLGISLAAWAAAFAVAAIRPQWIGQWTGLILLTTWPAFAVGFIRFAVRWHRAYQKAVGE
jgi:hypothetical protein